jgi:MFS family permease
MGPIYYGWWIVFACFPIGLYVGGIVFYGFTAFFDIFVKEFGWSYTEVSFAASLRGVEAGILSPVVGFLVDRLGSRKLILAGTLLTGLGMLLLSFTRSLTTFYCAFFLLALGASGCMGIVAMTTVANWFDKDAGKAFGVMSSAFGASGLIVPLIVWLTGAFPWRTVFVILGLGAWVLGVPLSFVVRQRPEHGPCRGDEKIPLEEKNHRRVQQKGSEVNLRKALKNRVFLYLAVAEGLRIMGVSAVVIHVMPYLAHAGISRPTAGLVAAAIPLTSILGRFGFGWLADVWNKKYTMAVSLGFFDLGLLAFCFAKWTWPILPFLFFFSTGLGGGMVVRGSMLKESFGNDSFGRLLGILMGLASIGGIIGPTFVGWIFDTFKSYHLAWIGLSAALLLPIALILSLSPKQSAD